MCATDLINWAAEIFPSQEVKDRSGFANNDDNVFILAMFYRPFDWRPLIFLMS